MDAEELAALPLFAGLSPDERREVARSTDEVRVGAGETLAREGSFAHEFCVILDGTVEVTRGGERLRELGRGEFFGEIGLLESERRTATVTATSPVRLAVVFGPRFQALEHRLPAVGERVRAAIRERLG